MTLAATAPGKVMLAGEYAVIDGAEAILVAVNRRVRAEDTGGAQSLSPFLEAVRAAAADFGGNPDRAARIAAVSDALRNEDGTKLGLGSSAAVTVAAAAIALGRDATPQAIHTLAHHAHRTAQGLRGAKGSGADIAACTHGGVIAARVGDHGPDAPMVTRRLTLPADLHLVFVWTGKAADTAPLVARVRRYRASMPEVYEEMATRVADAARSLGAALGEAGDAAAAVDAIADGFGAIAALGDAAGVPLASHLHHDLHERAVALGGAAKPTGAGAGDIAVAAFTDAQRAQGFRELVEAKGILCPDLRVDPRGIAFE